MFIFFKIVQNYLVYNQSLTFLGMLWAFSTYNIECNFNFRFERVIYRITKLFKALVSGFSLPGKSCSSCQGQKNTDHRSGRLQPQICGPRVDIGNSGMLSHYIPVILSTVVVPDKWKSGLKGLKFGPPLLSLGTDTGADH